MQPANCSSHPPALGCYGRICDYRTRHRPRAGEAAGRVNGEDAGGEDSWQRAQNGGSTDHSQIASELAKGRIEGAIWRPAALRYAASRHSGRLAYFNYHQIRE